MGILWLSFSLYSSIVNRTEHVSFSKAGYYISKKLKNIINRIDIEKITIRKMSNQDIQTFFSNRSNTLRERMEYDIEKGEDVATPLEVGSDDTAPSIILLNNRHESDDLFYWDSPKQYLYIMNPCIQVVSKDEYGGVEIEGYGEKRVVRGMRHVISVYFKMIERTIGGTMKIVAAHAFFYGKQAISIQDTFRLYVGDSTCFYQDPDQ